MQINEILAKELYDARIRKHLRQCDVAEFCEIDNSHYQNIERGRKLPSTKVLFRMASILGLSLDYIVHPENSNPKVAKIKCLLTYCNENQLDVIIAALDVMVSQNQEHSFSIKEDIDQSKDKEV